MPKRLFAPRSPRQLLRSLSDCRSCRSSASWALASAPSRAQLLAPRFWPAPSNGRLRSMFFATSVPRCSHGWLLQAWRGDAPRVRARWRYGRHSAAASPSASTSGCFSLLAVSSCSRWRESTGPGFAAVSCGVDRLRSTNPDPPTQDRLRIPTARALRGRAWVDIASV
jgi:hypothetical protein